MDRVTSLGEVRKMKQGSGQESLGRGSGAGSTGPECVKPGVAYKRTGVWTAVCRAKGQRTSEESGTRSQQVGIRIKSVDRKPETNRY